MKKNFSIKLLEIELDAISWILLFITIFIINTFTRFDFEWALVPIIIFLIRNKRIAYDKILEFIGFISSLIFLFTIQVGMVHINYRALIIMLICLVINALVFKVKLKLMNIGLFWYVIVLNIVVAIMTYLAHYSGQNSILFIGIVNATLLTPWVLINYINTFKRVYMALISIFLSTIVFFLSVWEEFIVRSIDNFQHHSHQPISYLLGMNLITLETATFSTMAFIIFFLLLWTSKSKKEKIVWSVFVALAIGVMALSSERITFVNGVIGLILVTIFYFDLKKILKLLVVIAICLAILIPIQGKVHTISKYTDRLSTVTSTENASNDGRFVMWQASINSIKEHPLLGIGYWNVYDMIRSYIIENPNNIYIEKKPQMFQAEIIGKEWIHVHNIYLEMFVILGLFGGFYFVLFLILIPYYLYKLFKKCGKNKMLIGITLLFISYFIAGMTDEVFFSWPILRSSFDVFVFGLLIIELQSKNIKGKY